jgi:hypothetical protein
MTSLVDNEADDAFWGQEFFKDEAGDNEYENVEGTMIPLTFLIIL